MRSSRSLLLVAVMLTEKVTRIPDRPLVLLGNYVSEQKVEACKSCPRLKIEMADSCV
jgi:hypothetical protein